MALHSDRAPTFVKGVLASERTSKGWKRCPAPDQQVEQRNAPTLPVRVNSTAWCRIRGRHWIRMLHGRCGGQPAQLCLNRWTPGGNGSSLLPPRQEGIRQPYLLEISQVGAPPCLPKCRPWQKVRAEWSELLGRPLDLLRPDLSTQHVPAAIITDAKSVYDCVSKGDTTSFNMKEKYTALELMSVFNHLEAQRTALLWVASDSQLADGLTKGSASEMLTRFFQGHQVWAASFDPEFVAAKKKKKKGKTSTPATSPEPDESAEFDEDLSWRGLVARSHPASSGTFHEEFLGHVSSVASAFEGSLQVPDMPRRFCSGNPSATRL